MSAHGRGCCLIESKIVYVYKTRGECGVFLCSDFNSVTNFFFFRKLLQGNDLDMLRETLQSEKTQRMKSGIEKRKETMKQK